MRTRPKRSAVRLSAEMRSDTGRRDVRILDVSERGMMLSQDDREPPPPGSYLEVRRGTIAIVARIVWRRGRRFGITSQDVIDPQRLITTSALPDIDAGAAARRKGRRPAPVETAARSRHFARLFQYGVLLVAIGAGTVALAGSVTRALAPLRTIEASLIGG